MAKEKSNTRRKWGSKLIKATLLAIAVLIQLAVIILPVIFFKGYLRHINWILEVLSILAVLYILRSDQNPVYKIPWIIAIMAFPVLGGILYFIYGRYHFSRKEAERTKRLEAERISALMSQPYANALLDKQAPHIIPETQYLFRNAHSPAYGNTTSQFFPLGDDMFPVMLEELAKAEKFIFMEFFIVEEGEMLDPIIDLLAQKAEQGVEVRFCYDSFGSLLKTQKDFVKRLRQKRIQCYEFNTFRSIFDARYNNRDHRKICVIDGRVAFTGGVNLADEYINRRQIFGHWKDTGIMIKGDAVWSFTTMFLTLWDESFKKEDHILEYKETVDWDYDDGFYIPYTDYPTDNEPVGKNVYLNMISRAEKSVYIMTPYLILDNVMTVALSNAAKSGVDVRIITPGIPDKKLVFMLTRSYYEVLIESGVKIYEYSPGFVHSKLFIGDGISGIIGTINLDYRSLAHHYENAVWMYNTKAIDDMTKDYMDTLSKCHEVTLEESKKKNILESILLPILRLFSPLM